MKYTGYKLDFKTAVHFGAGHLEDAGHTLYADTIFSALCHEAVSNGVLDELIEVVKNGKLMISDALPYHNDTYYLPKPMIAIETESDSTVKKKVKNLDYIEIDSLDDYINGCMDVAKASEHLSSMGSSEIRIMVSVDNEEETTPFSVGTYRFNDGWGLYIIIGYEADDTLYMLEDLLISLQYSGIGGKKSAGLGKFILFPANMPAALTDRIVTHSESRVMTMSISCCDDDNKDVCKEASYKLIKRSGFISSETYSKNNFKKQDLYCYKSGAVFSGTFNGALKDVSLQGNHPVYRYAIPMFLEV